ncbi:MAG TPA: type I-U CRISPR-associated RAMP protein Csb1/Cas7u [Chloroflexota bacterium]|nr:type I-U CRISPR-associated RAMP protein Csb1/Cas7u [Chloroflexota bacterium]
MATAHTEIDWASLEEAPRLLAEVTLRPVQGQRFQPTGFPDLGAATYSLNDGTLMLVVESAQSMANRFETVCWDTAKDELIADLAGLPYVRVKLDDKGATTSSILEAHRLNSPYILGNQTFKRKLLEEMKLPERVAKGKTRGKTADPNGATEPSSEETAEAIVDLRRIAPTIFRYDPCSLIHGVFLEKLNGRVRFTRALSAFIEARKVAPVASGGVKNDRYAPKPPGSEGFTAKEGFGNVPFHRTEYTADEITLFVNLDLGLIRGYGLPDPATRLLTSLALWKVRAFLDGGLRLRTACDLECASPARVKSPAEFALPPNESLIEEVKRDIRASADADLFAAPAITRLTFSGFSQKVVGEKVAEAEEDSTL